MKASCRPASKRRGGGGETTSLPARRRAFCLLAVLAAFAAADAGAGGRAVAVAQSLRVTHIEVAQVIQDPGNSVRLVARKENTLARVYLQPEAAGGPTGTNVTLSSRLRVVSGAGRVLSVAPTDSVTLDPGRQVGLREMHDNIGATLNFRLPPDAIVAGRATLSLEGLTDAATGGAFPCSNCNSFESRVVFEEVPALRVRVLGMRYILTEPGSIAMSRVEPSEEDYRRILSWLKRTYPTPDVEFSSLTQPLDDPISPGSFSCADALPLVSLTRSLELRNNRNKNLQRTHYYALIKDANGRNFVAGCSPAPSFPDPSAVGAGPTGAPSLKSFSLWKTDGTYGDYYAGHEIGHGLGRRHPGKCPDRNERGETDPEQTFDHINDPGGMLAGYDFGDNGFNPALPFRILPGDRYRDVMTYCDNQWVSKHTYERIMDRLIEEKDVYPDRAEGPSVIVGPEPQQSLVASAAAGGRGASNVRRSRVFGLAMSRPGSSAPALSAAADAAPQQTPTPQESPTPAAGPTPAAAPAGVQKGAGQYDARLLQKVETGDFINIFGTVNITNRTGKLLPPIRAEEAETRNKAVTERPEGPALKIQYLGKGGDQIGVYYLPLKSTTADAKDGTVAYVQGAVPVARNITKINFSLVGGEGAQAAEETLLISRDVDDSAPKIKEMAVSRTEGGPGSDPSKLPLDVRWTPAGRGGEEVHYIVELSKDGGPWETYAPYHSGTSIFVYPDSTWQAANVREVKVRVTAIDGFNKFEKEFKYTIKQ